MKQSFLYIPVAVAALFVFCSFAIPTTYAPAALSLLSFAVFLATIAAALRWGTKVSLRSLTIGHWLCVFFALCVIWSVFTTRNPGHAFFGFMVDLTSGVFLVVAALAAVASGHLSLPLRNMMRIACAILALFIVLFPFVRSEVSIRPSFDATLAVATAAYSAEGSHLIVAGSGPGSFVYLWQKYKPSDVLKTPWWNENFTTGSGVLPTIALECGALAVLALLLIFLFSAGEEVFRACSPRLDVAKRSIHIFSAVGASAFLALLVFAEPSSMLLAAAFIYVGTVVPNRNWELQLALIKKTAIVLAALFVILLVYLAISLWLYFRAYGLAQSGEMAGARRAGDISFALLHRAETARLLAQVARAQGHALGKDGENKKEIIKMFADASEYANKSVVAELENADSWKLLGIGLAERLALEPTQELFERGEYAFSEAEKRAPLDPSIPYFKAQLYVLAGRRETAKAELERALQLKPDYTAASELLQGFTEAK